MDVKKHEPVLHLLWIAAATFALHQLYFYVFASPVKEDFHYALWEVYAFFSACSALILLALVKVRQKSIDNVGYAFLLLTCAKMAVAYAFINPVLQSSGKSADVESLNFFFVFALFLAIETTLSIRILNQP